MIKTATNIKCPECIRKLCKIREYDSGNLIEVMHKGALVLSVEAIVKCLGCKKHYRVNADHGLMEEVDIGR